MPGTLPGLALARALVGAAIAWAWVVAVLFVGQERAMHDVSQSCMLAGAAVALCAFAALDLRGGTRGPELSRGAMRALSCAVTGFLAVTICIPDSPTPPELALNAAWTLTGVFGAYTIRRSFHLVAALAGKLGGLQVLEVSCALLAGGTVLAFMASSMPVRQAAFVMLACVPTALWLLPQGRLVLDDGFSREGAAPAGVANTENVVRTKTSARGISSPAGLAPHVFCLAALGFTSGFHTSVGRVLYSDYLHFGNVFVVILFACWIYAILGRKVRRTQGEVSPAMLQVPLACACVVFVPLLFLNDEPDDASWELVQNVLVFLSTCALLASMSVLARADASTGKPGGKRATPFCAAGVAAFSLGLFTGWLAGQVAYDMGGASGWAFRIGVTTCIALLVSVILVTGMRPGRGDLPTSAERLGNTVAHGQAGAADWDKRETRPLSVGNKEPSPTSPLGSGVVTGGQPSPAGDSQSSSIEIAGGEKNVLDNRPCPTSTDDNNQPDVRITAIDRVTHRYGLSEREHALLMLLAEGLTAQQAAERLTVSRNTVKSHMAHIYAKCGVHTRAELNELLDGGEYH